MPRLDRMRAKHLLGSLSFRIASLRSFLSREIRKEEEGRGGREIREERFSFSFRKSKIERLAGRRSKRGTREEIAGHKRGLRFLFTWHPLSIQRLVVHPRSLDDAGRQAQTPPICGGY